ncbi:MAG TPA: hypothetical protein VGN17_05140 [Bryobacteraceae bacterium]|jgi:hypothetical protein
MQLPAGSWIVFPSVADAQAFRAVAINETKDGPTKTTVVLTAPMCLASTAYMVARDKVELQLHQQIDENKTKVDAK